MKKKLFTLAIVSVLFFPLTSQAQSKHDISYNISYPYVSVLAEAGRSAKVTSEIILPNREAFTLYPVGLVWREYANYFQFSPSTWLYFPQERLNLPKQNDDHSTSFTFRTPSDAIPGEYHHIAAFGTAPFSTQRSDNPPVFVGIPITIQLSRALTQKPGRSTPLAEDLTTQLEITNFSKAFNWLGWRETFQISIKNNGNISGIPNGFVDIQDLKGSSLKTLPFNDAQLAIYPQAISKFETDFKPTAPIIGVYKAKLKLGTQATFKPQQMSNQAELYFVYISPEFVLIGFILLLIGYLYHTDMHLHFRKKFKIYRYLHFVILGLLVVPTTIISIELIDLESHANTILGITTDKVIPKPPQEKNMSVNARSKENIGLRIITRQGKKIVQITSSTPKGWRLYSIRPLQSQFIASDVTDTGYTREVELNGENTHYPILLFTRLYASPQE